MTDKPRTFRYVVMRRPRGDGDGNFYAIYERHVDDIGFVGYTADPMEPMGDSPEELRADLMKMIAALDGKIYDYDSELPITA